MVAQASSMSVKWVKVENSKESNDGKYARMLWNRKCVAKQAESRHHFDYDGNDDGFKCDWMKISDATSFERKHHFVFDFIAFLLLA